MFIQLYLGILCMYVDISLFFSPKHSRHSKYNSELTSLCIYSIQHFPPKIANEGHGLAGNSTSTVFVLRTYTLYGM